MRVPRVLREHPRHDSSQKCRGGYEQGAPAEGAVNPDTLTVLVRVGGSNARYAAPSADQKKGFVYAALLYPDGSPSGDFVPGASDDSGTTITFLFQKPPLADGEKLTLEIFAFAKGTAEADLSKDTALLIGKESGLEAEDGSITVDAMTLSPNAADTAPKGTVSLKVRVPSGCTLEIDDTANFAVDGTTPTFTVKNAGAGIPAGSYGLTFNVKKGSEMFFPFSDSITVLPGMCTDTWSGLPSSELEADGTRNVSEMAGKTLYVRGAGGWYDTADPGKTAYAADDDNPGSFLKPFATIQRAIDTVIARNDGASEYTIFVDGTLTLNASATDAMANVSSGNKALALKIVSLHPTQKATLNANGYANTVITLAILNSTTTLERLVITGGANTFDGSGGGIYIGHQNVFIVDCEIKDNTSATSGGGIRVYDNSGTFSMKGCTVSGNSATDDGGGMYVANRKSDAITIEGCVFSDNTARNGGGILYANVHTGSDGPLILKDCTVSKNTVTGNGGGVYLDASGIMMEGGKISGNTATSGGGVYVGTGGTFAMNGGTIGGSADDDGNTADIGGGVYVDTDGEFTMEDGAMISKNTAIVAGYVGGGVYNNGAFMMKANASISKNTATKGAGGGVCVGSTGVFTMEGGTISENKTMASSGYGAGGVYVSTGTFKMDGGKISGNTADFGGGVSIANRGKFDMTGGEISGNTAKNPASGILTEGGGVKTHGGTFTMSGGEVKGNFGNTGAGVYVYYNDTFTMSRAAKVAEDNDIYLDYYAGSTYTYIAKIQVDGALTATPPVATITPKAYEDGRQVLEAVGGGKITQAVCDQFALAPAPNGGDWKIVPDSTGAYGVLALPIVYLNSSTGADTNSGLSAANAVATLSKAVELFEAKNASKIVVCATYTLPSSEISLLDRMGGGKEN